MIAARYLERNPHLLLPSAMAEISDHGNNNIMPITHGAQFDLLTEAGQFTSACALTVYSGGAFPDGYEGTTFIAEPVHNLVHRDVLTPKGLDVRGEPGRATTWSSWRRRTAGSGRSTSTSAPRARCTSSTTTAPTSNIPEWASSDMQKTPDGALHRQGPRAHLPCRGHDRGGSDAHRAATEAWIGHRRATRRGARQPQRVVAPDGAAPAGARQAA